MFHFRDVVKKIFQFIEPSLLANPSSSSTVDDIVKVLVEHLEYFREGMGFDYAKLPMTNPYCSMCG